MPKRVPSTPQKPDSGNKMLEGAVAALRVQRFAEAERVALDVLKANRGNLLATQILGRALLAQHRADEAIKPLQRAARRSSDPAVETLLAKVLAAAGQMDEALELLRRTTARQPVFSPAFLELSEQLSKYGRFDDAVPVLEDGLRRAPESTDLQMALGILHFQRNDRVRARQLFLEVRVAAPERHDAIVALAKVMVLDGEHAAAAELYRHALGLRPDDTATRIDLAKCLLEMREREAGEAALRAATRGAAALAGPAILALATAPHGRFFLRPSDAAKFLQVEKK